MSATYWFIERTQYIRVVTGVPDRAEIIPIEPEPGHAGGGSVSMQSFRTPKTAAMKPICTLFLFLTICLRAEAQTSIAGTVINTLFEPVSNTQISILNGAKSTLSKEDGSFALKDLSPGSYELVIIADGYMPYRRVVNTDTSIGLRITLLSLREPRAVNHELVTTAVQAGLIAMSPLSLREIPVIATRSGESAGMTRTLLEKKDLEELNTGQDLPYLLQLTPSAVITSDAGNGIGYTGIRIRGSDPTRINVTMNGIPLNDAESQLVYWVNMPDFASSVENIEITRGAGSSTNGAGAFGASVNILTQNLRGESYAEASSAAGSFNTLKTNIGFGTGLLGNRFIVEGRLSRITSDGYVDRASSDLKSFYLTGQYRGKRSSLRANIFSGREETYQSWYGVPESRINNDLQGMIDYSIRNGLSEEETENLINSGRTYNYYTYPNQVDNYGQDHYQLHYSLDLPKGILLQLALHATKGGGYYEEYKAGENIEEYGIAPVIIGTDTLTESDLIRRRWLDNWFYGSTFSLRGVIRNTLTWTWGGAVNRYDGDHFGEIQWARTAGNSEAGQRYYSNNAVKDDYNTFLKTEYNLSDRFLLYTDIQLRRVDYRFTGPDEDGTPAPQNAQLIFFNPKAAITWNINNKVRTYASFAVARKEPNRNDYTESSMQSRPRPETLRDWETGVKYSNRNFTGSLNAYFMDYIDQLVLTGQINDVGSYTRTNIDRSYRTGIELEGGFRISDHVAVEGNATFNENRIRKYTEYTDAYDADFNYIGQEPKTFSGAPIAFSPALTSTLQFTYKPRKNLDFRLIGRHVGEQYMDNTGSRESMLKAYSVVDLRSSWTPNIKGLRTVRIDLLLNNILNSLYSSNGYTFGYQVANTRIRENFFYPQAGLNWMGQLTIAF